MQRSTILVDIAAVRFIVERNYLGSKSPEQIRSEIRRSTVRAIDGNAKTVEPQALHLAGNMCEIGFPKFVFSL